MIVRRASWHEEDEIARLLSFEEFTAQLQSRPVPLALIRRAVRRCLANEELYQTEFYLGMKRGRPFCVPAHRHHCDTSNFRYLCCPNLELIAGAPSNGQVHGVIRLPTADREPIHHVKALLSPDNRVFLRRVEKAGFQLHDLVLLQGHLRSRRILRWRIKYINFRWNTVLTPPWQPYGEFVHCLEQTPEVFEVHKAKPFHAPYLVQTTLHLYRSELRQSLGREELSAGIRFAIENHHPVFGCFYVLTRDSKPIGAVRLFSEMSMRNHWRVYVRRPWLDPQHRGKGLAVPFLKTALAHFWPGGDIELRTLLAPRVLTGTKNRQKLLGLFGHLGLDLRTDTILAETA